MTGPSSFATVTVFVTVVRNHVPKPRQGAQAESWPANWLDVGSSTRNVTYEITLSDGTTLNSSVRVLMREIPKHVSTTAYYIQSFALHQKISFNFFSRSLIKSMSCFGVLMPCVDFFWKA
jgi:hypothetical protein